MFNLLAPKVGLITFMNFLRTNRFFFYISSNAHSFSLTLNSRAPRLVRGFKERVNSPQGGMALAAPALGEAQAERGPRPQYGNWDVTRRPAGPHATEACRSRDSNHPRFMIPRRETGALPLRQSDIPEEQALDLAGSNHVAAAHFGGRRPLILEMSPPNCSVVRPGIRRSVFWEASPRDFWLLGSRGAPFRKNGGAASQFGNRRPLIMENVAARFFSSGAWHSAPSC